QPDAMSLDLVRKPEFTFAVISDTHVAEPGRESKYAHSWRVERVIKQLNLLKPAFVINCGDIITGFPCRPEFPQQCENALKLFSRLKVPIHYVPGNHDVGNKLSMRFSKRHLRFGSIYISEDYLKTYRKYFGRDFYSFDYGGCHFVILNDQLFNSGLPSEKRQWEWLLEDLEKSKNSRFKFMFMHVPIFWVSPNDVGPNNYEVIDPPRRDDLLSLIKKYRFRIVFTGHTHHRISNWYQGTEFLTVPSTTFARPFGYHYGVSGLSIIYDERKVGYFIVRVYRDDVQVNLVRTYEGGAEPAPIQADPGESARIVSLKSQEIEDNLFGLKGAPVPPIERGAWDVNNLVDGRLTDVKHPQLAPSIAWVSEEHDSEFAREWIRIDMSVVRKVNRVELAPRLGGKGFPRDFEIQLSMDGKKWETVVEKRDFPPPPAPQPDRFEFPTREAKHVRLLMTRLPEVGRIAESGEKSYRASLAEIGVYLDKSPNYASRLLGSRISASSNISNKVVVDDNAWIAPTNVGVKWVRIPAEATSWETVERWRGELAVSHSLQRALDIGRPRGVNLVMPLTTRNLLYTGADRLDAFGRYCAFLAKWFEKSIACWELSERDGIAPEYAERAIREIKSVQPNATFALGKLRLDEPVEISRFAARWSRKDYPIRAVIVSARVSAVPEGEFATQLQQAAQAVGKINPEMELWVDATVEAASSKAAAKRVARAYMVALENRARFFLWADLGESAAILDKVFNPTAGYYVVRALTTLFGSDISRANPPRITLSRSSDTLRTFVARDGNGFLLVALWNAVRIRDDAEPIRCDLVVQGKYEEISGIDVLSCTVRDVRFQRE
ncbi:MAG: hypothetical protein DRN07_08795, partial [Thermoplasmata archaeon]